MCKFARRAHSSEHFIPPHWSMICVTSRWRQCPQTHPSLPPCPHSPSRCIGLRLGWTQPRGQVALSTNMHSAKSYNAHANTHARARATTAKIYIDFLNVITPGHSKSHAAGILTVDNISKMKNTHSSKYSREQCDVEQACTLSENTAE